MEEQQGPWLDQADDDTWMVQEDINAPYDELQPSASFSLDDDHHLQADMSAQLQAQTTSGTRIQLQRLSIQEQRQQQEQQQQSGSNADDEFIPVDATPSFEVPGTQAHEHMAELTAAASAAAAATVVRQAAEDTQLQQSSGMQLDDQHQQEAPGISSSSSRSHRTQQQPAALLPWPDDAAAPVADVQPPMNEAAVAELEAQQQQQSDQDLLAFAADEGPDVEPAAAVLDLSKMPPHDAAMRASAPTAAAAQALDHQPGQQQRQKHKEQPIPDPIRSQADAMDTEHSDEQLGIDELLQPTAGQGQQQEQQQELPSLEEPGVSSGSGQPQQQQRSSMNVSQALRTTQGTGQPSASDGSSGDAFAGGVGQRTSATHLAADPPQLQDFGLPAEAPPVLPDEPPQLLSAVAQHPADGLLLS